MKGVGQGHQILAYLSLISGCGNISAFVVPEVFRDNQNGNEGKFISNTKIRF